VVDVSDFGSELPSLVSITTIQVRHWWQMRGVASRWKRLVREFAAAGYRFESRVVTRLRSREVMLVTLAAREDDLRRAAASRSHVDAVRWTIPRRRKLWSAVYALDGWSSMSGPLEGSWSIRPLRQRPARGGEERERRPGGEERERG
jgi:hypothetical protein